MAEPTVNVTIRSDLKGTGLKDAAAGNDLLQKELAQTETALKATQTAAAKTDDTLKDHGKAARAAADDLDTTAKAADGAAKKGVNFGQAMLQGGRGVQDFSAAGIPGVVNNVESLASALGLGASAAGGFTLAFVAIEVLMRNWDTWFGPEKAEQAKAFWSAMTPDEAQMTRLREANEALENQAKNLERIAEARKASIQAEREADELLKKKAELWKDITPTPDERGDLPPLPGTEPETEAMKEARRKVEEKKAETQAKKGIFQGMDAATTEQQRRVDAMNQIATLPERTRLANDKDARALAGLDTSFDEAGGPNSPEQMKQAEEIRARMKRREAEMRSQIQSVPGLTDGLTGDPEKDREQLQARAAQERERLAQLEAQRLQAARDAEAAARAQAQAEQGVTGQASLENEQRATNAQRVLADNDPNMMIAPPPGQFAGSDERGGLTEALARLNAGQQQSTAAAQQVTQAADSVVAQSTQLQQKLTGALSILAEAIAAIGSKAQATASELEQYRDANRK